MRGMSDWPPPENKRPLGFTAGKDGWFKWYKGKTRFVASKTVKAELVPEIWQEKRKAIDQDSEFIIAPSGKLTYRQVLSGFMDHCHHRNKTGKPTPLSDRSVHNYEVILNDFGNHVGGGKLIENVNRPEIFTEYAKKFADWKASGYDSVVSRIGALFNWAIEMEYIQRWRCGPMFRRPAKSDLRSERIDLAKYIEPATIAKLYNAADDRMKLWIGLGLCAAFTNSDIAHVARECVDLDTGVIDFRRRKTGKIRRVCPLPGPIATLMRNYKRPEPADKAFEDYFFLTKSGHPFGRTRKTGWNPSDTISRFWKKNLAAAEVVGPVFTGLRTTFYNLAPGGEYELERKIVMGRARGNIDLDSYLERFKLERLVHVVGVVWAHVSISLKDSASEPPDSHGPAAS